MTHQAELYQTAIPNSSQKETCELHPIGLYTLCQLVGDLMTRLTKLYTLRQSKGDL